MNTVLLLSETQLEPSMIAAVLATRLDASARLTSASRVAVERGDCFAAMLIDDAILDDYEKEEFESIGMERDRLHVSAIEFRTVGFLREVLGALMSEIQGAVWIDNDHGRISPLGEFLRRTDSGDDVANL